METNTLLQKAQKELVNGNNQEAFIAANEVLKLNPKDAKAFLVAGYACECMDDMDQAITLYESALECDLSPEVVVQLRRAVEKRAKIDPSVFERCGDRVLGKGKEYEAVFTRREQAAYDRFIRTESGRRLPMQISQKPGGAKSVTEPHFGGEPYAESGTTWPTCNVCSRAKNFIGQFAWDPSVNDISKESLTTDWLITAFHCFACKSAAKQTSDCILYKTPKVDAHVPIAPGKEVRAPHLVALPHYRYEVKDPELVVNLEFLPGSDPIPNKYKRAKQENAPGFEESRDPYKHESDPDQAFIGGLDGTVATLLFGIKIAIRYDSATDSCIISRE